MGSPEDAAVRAIGLQRHFDGTEAVEGLDLQIDKGEIYGFLGPNGAGKSTTVRMVCTLLAPTGGQAFVAGHDVATEPGAVRLRIGAAWTSRSTRSRPVVSCCGSKARSTG